MTHLLIADDHPLFRMALSQAVRSVVPGAQVAQADSLDSARAALARDPETDLVLLDLHMPGSHGLMGLAALRGEFPSVAVVMISAHDDPNTIRRALAFGAAGFIPKRYDLERLRDALRRVLQGEEYLPEEVRPSVAATGPSGADRTLAMRLARLTPQQIRVLALVAEGRLNKQIADALGIQERTVKAHVSAIFDRLEVRNRTQAGVLLRSLELSDPAQTVAPAPFD